MRAGYLTFVSQEHVLECDSIEYDTIGWNLAQGHGYSIVPGIPTPIRAPAYPYMLAAVYSVFGHSLPAARWFQAFLGAITCLFIYATGRRFLNERNAFLAGILMAVYPVLIVYTGFIYSETLAVYRKVCVTG